MNYEKAWAQMRRQVAILTTRSAEIIRQNRLLGKQDFRAIGEWMANERVLRSMKTIESVNKELEAPDGKATR
jgi:hypothetical protein